MDVSIRHTTRYAFIGPVVLGRHRLIMRPRDSFDMRILETGVSISPPADLSWTHDCYGNSVCRADFASAPTEQLVIESRLVIRRYLPSSPSPTGQPWKPGESIAYTEDERTVLLPFMTPAVPEGDGAVTAFAASLAQRQKPGVEHPLQALAQGIHERLTYQIRFDEGTQGPAETLELGTGSCRDYAWLFIECARRLGYAARFVTGYLHSTGAERSLTAPSAGYSHAWAEAYLPGDGWVEFDPTNLLVGHRRLIRVAVTRTPREASPVSGTYFGPPQRAVPQVEVIIAPVAAAA